VRKINLKLKTKSYQIIIGNHLIGQTLPRMRKITQAIILTDRKLSKIARTLSWELKNIGAQIEQIEITASEKAKDYQNIFPLYSRLIKSNMDRNSVLFAIGGGVTGDIAGFVASTYLRGIRWVGIPTTLVAQVDSAIGGKTGVNHPLGKNLIGTFHQPSLVLCDVDLLKTLSQRDRLSGLGEIIKYGLAFDAKFFRKLQRNWKALLRLDKKPLIDAITTCVQWKAKIVQMDEFEKGNRRLLNLGHTLGHAYEAATDYTRFRHGEAIILGLRIAASLSREKGHLKPKTQVEIDAFLEQLPIPKVPAIAFSKLLTYTRRDKKVTRGKLNFVLLRGIGKTVIDRNVTEKNLKNAIRNIGIPLR